MSFGSFNGVFAALALAVLAAVVFAPSASAQVVHEPDRDNPLRRELLDAARPAFVSATGGDVEFVVNRLAAWGNWAFGSVRVQRPGGRAIDWSQTEFAGELRAGVFSPDISFFLLVNDGRGWFEVANAIGPSDVAWEDWRQRFRLPRELFTP